MSKIIFGTSLFIVFIVTGCTNSHLHQSLLLHENRQLEDALYVAHAQIADLRRENNSLRRQQTNDFPEPPRRPRVDSWESIDTRNNNNNSWDIDPWNNDGWNTPPSLEMPRILVPNEPSRTEPTEWQTDSQRIHNWSPVR